MCMCEHVNFTPSLIYWAASCLADYPASSRCQICHLQMSGRVCGAEEWRVEIGVERRRGNRITGSADIWNVFRRVSKRHGVWMVLRGLSFLDWKGGVLNPSSFNVWRAILLVKQNARSSILQRKKFSECFTDECICRLFVIIIIITGAAWCTSLWVVFGQNCP